MNYNYYLNYNTSINILHAVDYAKYIGRPLNLLVTIFFMKNNPIKDYNKTFKLMNRAKNIWLKKHYKDNGKAHVPPMGVHVFENPKGHTHVHWLLYIPQELIETFYKKIEKWLKRYQGDLENNAIKIQEVNPYTDKTTANYMIKGIDPIIAAAFGAEKRQAYQGPIKGQRARSSTALARTARKRAGFDARLHRHQWIEKHPELAAKYKKPDNWSVAKVTPQLFGKHTLPTVYEIIQALFGGKKMIDITPDKKKSP